MNLTLLDINDLDLASMTNIMRINDINKNTFLNKGLLESYTKVRNVVFYDEEYR